MTDRPRILALFGSAVLFGQERGNIEALAALKEEGCEVLCLVRDEAWNVSIPRALEARGLAWASAPYIEHRLPGRMGHVVFRNPVAFLRANWRLLRVAGDFHPTHIHAFNQLYVFNFLVGLVVLRTPMVYRGGDEPTLHNWIWRTSWKFVLWRTERYVANARFVAKKFREHGVSESSITVIYNRPPQRPKTDSPLPPLPEADHLFRIAYVGQLIEEKGIDLLVGAFRQVIVDYPNARLLIAGRISEWRGDDWARHLRDTTLTDPVLHNTVSFLGEIVDVPGLLARAHVHVVPSLINDASPNVIMEAKQAGCLSVVFPLGGMPELVQHDVDGLVCAAATSEDLVDALRYYLSNAGLAQSHGRAARASLTRLGVEHFAQRWLEVYSPASQGRPPVSNS